MTRVEDYTWLPCHFVHHHRHHLLKLTRCESRMQVQGSYQIRWCGQGCLICSSQPRTSLYLSGQDCLRKSMAVQCFTAITRYRGNDEYSCFERVHFRYTIIVLPAVL